MSALNPAIKDGDYISTNNTYMLWDSVLSEIYFCLATPYGSYIYDQQLGNKMLLDDVFLNKKLVQEYCAESISRLINNNRISNVAIRVEYSIQQNRYNIDITTQSADNNFLSVSFMYSLNGDFSIKAS